MNSHVDLPADKQAPLLSVWPQAVYHGPNAYAREPVVVVEMALAAHPGIDAERLEAGLLALSSPWFGSGVTALPAREGGQRLALFLVHWSLGVLNHVRGYLHAAGVQAVGPQGRLVAWLGFHDPAISLATLRVGAKLIAEVARGQASVARVEAALEPVWRACRQHHPDYQARIVMEAARARDLPCSPAWGRPRHWQFGQGTHGRVLFESSSADDGCLGARVAASKAASKEMLRALGLPTPAYVLVSEAGALEAAAAQVGFPCASKPLDLGAGKGVSAGHATLPELQAGFDHARRVSTGPVMVERFVPGDDHRLMVVDGRLRAAIRRLPAYVIGDGRASIRQLVDTKNAGRDARSPRSSGYLRPIPLDEPALRHLAVMGMTPQTVPALGKRVTLRSNANLSTGGSCMDVTEQVHPTVRTMVETLAETLHVRALGADYLTSDLGCSPQDVGGAFIEFNLTPGLDILVAAGWSAPEAGDLVLGPAVDRIPVHMVLVPDEDLDLFAWKLAASDLVPQWGWASAKNATLRGVPLVVQADHPWAGVRTLLAHRGVAGALLLCGAAQIERHGLPLDRLDGVHLCAVAVPDALMGVIARNSRAQTTYADARSALAGILQQVADGAHPVAGAAFAPGT